ncbi:MAG: hypothetical protein KIT68_05645, partial [Phycisphaeraceae bacterium]|nr:hypothetical protein [Phycisphaeraceae bacterium]
TTGGGNGLLTERRVYPDGLQSSSSPYRAWQFNYDARDRLNGVLSPEPPHALRSVDNLGRELAVGLYDWPGNTFPSNLDPEINSDRRIELFKQQYDPLGRVWRNTRWGLNNTGTSDSSAVLHTDLWYGPHGNVVLSAGETIQKYAYDRACRLVTCTTLAGTPADQTNVQARTVNASDIVLHEAHFIRNVNSGHVLAEVEISRHPRANFSATSPSFVEPGGGPLWTPVRQPGGGPGGGQFTIPHDIPGLISFKAYYPDEYGIPRKIFDYGNLGLDKSSGTDLTYCAGLCDVPVPDEPFRLFEPKVDERLWWCGIANSPTASSSVYEFDDAGRPIRLLVIPRTIPTNYDLPANEHTFDRDPCDELASKLGIRWFYYRGRQVETQITPIPENGTGFPTQRIIYPDQITNFPSNLDAEIQDLFPVPRVRRNDLPVAIMAPGAADSPINGWPQAMSAEHLSAADPVTWIARNGLGEPTAWRNPAGHETRLLDLDKYGRPRMAYFHPSVPTSTPNGLPDVYDKAFLLAMEYRWDGQPLRLRRWDDLVPGIPPTSPPSSAPSNEVQWDYDRWGLVNRYSGSPEGPVPVPPGGTELQFENNRWRGPSNEGTPGVPTHTFPGQPGPVRGWDNIRRLSTTLPGMYKSEGKALPLGMAYFTDRTSQPLSPMSEQGIDGLIGRPSGIHESGNPTTSIGLTRYAYHGIYKPSWRDFPEPQLERPIYTPGFWPAPHDTTDFPFHPAIKPVNGNRTRWEGIRQDIWRENRDGPITPGNENEFATKPPNPWIWVDYGYDPKAGGATGAFNTASLTSPSPHDGVDGRIRRIKDRVMSHPPVDGSPVTLPDTSPAPASTSTSATTAATGLSGARLAFTPALATSAATPARACSADRVRHQDHYVHARQARRRRLHCGPEHLRRPRRPPAHRRPQRPGHRRCRRRPGHAAQPGRPRRRGRAGAPRSAQGLHRRPRARRQPDPLDHR